MLILAIDTAAAQCAALVYDAATGREAGRSVLDLGKGHAEHLMAVIDRALAGAGASYAALGRIAVSVGPGSFTGVRVGVSAARGLALALQIPAVGVSTLEAVAAESRNDLPANILVAFESAGALQAALYDETDGVLMAPSIIDMDGAVRLAAEHRPILAGTAARRIAAAAGIDLPVGSERATADIGTYARLAAAKKAGDDKPKPLYLREPDARPQAGFVLPRA